MIHDLQWRLRNVRTPFAVSNDSEIDDAVSTCGWLYEGLGVMWSRMME